MDLMSQYQSLEDFTYSLVGLSVEEERKFCTALLAMSQLHAGLKVDMSVFWNNSNAGVSFKMYRVLNESIMNMTYR